MTKRLILSVMVLLLAACGGGNGTDSAQQQTNYTDFVLFEITNTAEDDEPIDVNDINFLIVDDVAQFDVVLI